MTHRFAALLGNGVSLAYNSNLAVSNLTTELVTEFLALGATDPERALKKLAEESHRAADGGFESMLGPLEATSTSLEALADLVPLLVSTVAANQLLLTQMFVKEIHRVGLAIVLDKIAKHSIGVGGSAFGAIEDFGDALKSLSVPSHLAVATLKYDGLTHAGLLCNSGVTAPGPGQADACARPGPAPIPLGRALPTCCEIGGPPKRAK